MVGIVPAMTAITTARLTPDPQRFPPGTSVSAYRGSAWSSSDRSVAPTGAADAGPVAVAADGTLTFTGLTDQTTYFAWAAATGMPVRFTTRHDYADDLASGVGSTSPSAVKTLPAGWNANFLAKLAQARAGSAIARVGFIGDSVEWGAWTSNPDTRSWPARVMAQIQPTYGDGGSGFKSLHDTTQFLTAIAVDAGAQASYATAGTLWTMTGAGWTATSVPSYMAGFSGLKTPTVGDQATTTFRGTTVTILTSPNAGANAAWRYRIDGGTPSQGPQGWQNVADAGAFAMLKTVVTGLSAGTHTIDIQNNGDGTKNFFLYGIIAENATGVVGYKLARYGQLAVNSVGGSIPAEQNNGGRNLPVDLAVIGLGLNDARAGTTADTFAAALITLLTELRNSGTGLTAASSTAPLAGYTGPDVMLVVNNVGKFDNATPKWPDYAQRIRAIASAYGCGVVNLWADGKQNWNVWQAVGYFGVASAVGRAGTDSVHISDAGAQHIADIVGPAILAPAT